MKYITTMVPKEKPPAEEEEADEGDVAKVFGAEVLAADAAATTGEGPGFVVLAPDAVGTLTSHTPTCEQLAAKGVSLKFLPQDQHIVRSDLFFVPQCGHKV